MLLQFAAENFRSIGRRVELSMRASPRVAEGSDSLVIAASPELRLLRCSALYGANASGKSNLVAAMRFAQDQVVRSPATRDTRLATEPFRLGNEWRNRPSCFEFYLYANERIYGYEFTVSDREVVRERLTQASPTRPSEEREIFRREGADFHFDAEFRAKVEEPKFLDYVAKGTRANQLFLNEAYERDVAELRPVYQWFEQTLVIIDPDTRYGPLVEEAEREPRFKAFLGDVLRWADTGIEGVNIRRSAVHDDVKREIEAMRRDKRVQALLSATRPLTRARDKLVEAPDGQAQILSMHFKHRAAEGGDVLDVEQESDGTMRLLDLVPMLYSSREHALVYIVDELDRSLHTLLAQRLIERFIAETSSAGRVPSPQLFFTTHDTNLLDCQRLRADGIWFAEKNRTGASQFYSLADYPPDQLAALCGEMEKGYLQGRFGGIPFLGDPQRLGWLGRANTQTPDRDD